MMNCGLLSPESYTGGVKAFRKRRVMVFGNDFDSRLRITNQQKSPNTAEYPLSHAQTRQNIQMCDVGPLQTFAGSTNHIFAVNAQRYF